MGERGKLENEILEGAAKGGSRRSGGMEGERVERDITHSVTSVRSTGIDGHLT